MCYFYCPTNPTNDSHHLLLFLFFSDIDYLSSTFSRKKFHKNKRTQIRGILRKLKQIVISLTNRKQIRDRIHQEKIFLIGNLLAQHTLKQTNATCHVHVSLIWWKSNWWALGRDIYSLLDFFFSSKKTFKTYWLFFMFWISFSPVSCLEYIICNW